MQGFLSLDVIGAAVLFVFLIIGLRRVRHGRPLFYPFVRNTSHNSRRMKVYLDIDGTLIHEELGPNYGQPAAGLDDFFKALRGYDCYWLTTHCMDGNPERARRILKSVASEDLHDLIDSIKPTSWSVNKSEALDLESNFLWFENDPSPEDLTTLAEHGTLQSLVQIDLVSDPASLMRVIRRLP